MNGIELGALRRLLHISRKNASRINDHRTEIDWIRWESSKELVPDGLALEVHEWAHRFISLIDIIRVNEEPDRVVAGLLAMQQRANDVQDGVPLAPDRKVLFDCLMQAAMGVIILDGDATFQKNGQSLQCMRRSLFLTVDEAAREIGHVSAAEWTAWETSVVDAAPEAVWAQLLQLGAWRRERVIEVVDSVNTDLVDVVARTGYTVWYDRIDDFMKFAPEGAGFVHWRATQSAQAEMFARRPEQFRAVVFDAREYDAVESAEGYQLMEWVRQAAASEAEARREKHRGEHGMYMPSGPAIH